MTVVAAGALLAPKRKSVDPSRSPDEAFDLWSIPAFDRGEPDVIAGREIGSQKQVVEDGDVLLSKIVPHIRRAWVVEPRSSRRQIASSEWIVFRSERAEPRYLRHLLVSNAFHREFMNTVSGVGGSLMRARPAHVARIDVPLPPIEEQRRIAAILDKADELRAKRRAALAHLDSLTQSIFHDMFGEDSPTQPLGQLLAEPLVNGTSPSAGGTVVSRVLTLSAITGHAFKEDAVKDAAFVRDPTKDRPVLRDRFLICRGNGNVDLVGRARFPARDLPGVAFPDTMIAARTKADRVVPEFLECAWAQASVRRQILGVARTTNGTFKVNQETLSTVRVACPPLRKQQRFAVAVGSVATVREAAKRDLTSLDELFASLQYRAFTGAL